MLVAGGAIFFYAPTDYLQGPVQRIFYLHVSSAIAAYGCFAVVLVGGLVYMRNESLVADRFARAGAATGVVFTTVTLVMGMRSEEHTSELQSHVNLVCRLLLEKKK